MILSIIVPVYKVERYLRRCVDSILAQTFRDFELILVDDGSPDGCPAICDEYAEKDSRVKVIHKKNGGLSDARNAGIEIAQGEYLGFVDSDDFIHPQMYEIMLRTANKTSADMVQCEKRNILLDEKIVCPELNADVEIQVYDVQEVLSQFYPKFAGQIPGFVIQKLYRREIFSMVQFPVGRLFEDIYILFPTLERCRKVALIDTTLYYYVYSPGSITRTKQTVKHISDHLDAFYGQMEYYRNRDRDQYYRAEEALLFNTFAWRKLYHDFGEYKAPGFNKVKWKMLKLYPEMLVNPHICKMQKLILILMMINKHLSLPLFKKYYPGWLPEFMRESK